MSFLNRIFGSKKKKDLEKFEFSESSTDNLINQQTTDPLVNNDRLNLPQSEIFQQQGPLNSSQNLFPQQNNNQNNFEPFNEMRQQNFVGNNGQTYKDQELLQIQKELEVISSKIETMKVLLENINQRLYVLENQQNARRF